MSDSSVMFQAQLSSVMEILFKAAVYEITKVVEGSFSHFRVEIAKVKKENESLRLRLQMWETMSTAEQSYGISHMGKTAPSVTSIGVQVCEEHTRKELGAGMKRKHMSVVTHEFSNLWEAKEPRPAGYKVEATDSCPVPELQSVVIKEEFTEHKPESLQIKEERSEVDLARRDPQEVLMMRSGLSDEDNIHFLSSVGPRAPEEVMKELRDELKTLKLQVRKLTEEQEQKQKHVQAPGQEDTCNGLKLSSLRSAVAHLSDDAVQEVMKILVLKVFKREELHCCSVTGKRSVKSGENPRPPLHPERLDWLEALVREKCPSVTHKIFVEKLQNIQKVLRRVHHNAESKKNATKVHGRGGQCSS
ncbi:uncharacterized protein LOC136764542 isoform X2 [Amia ocellicauda]|uniref:uncharacterized protein LOC136764542 isoform X2 n=1 Tax=Amia ocellicauda TaxID=2972642 RepID=UPI0034647C1F